ncbi:acyltransferase family protein [Corynebacterium lizhenjunii]|uniref:acyltransferase family protein n=1 Tax=Corynebacterium lizhenjunii TaxID=2709394 RepID=UPI0013ECA1FC|nr:acyltransferase family protein [Corynebacterium lizhenjunii]
MTSSPSVPATRPSLAYRSDIDGLRGLAIALVVVFHVFVGKVSSGVDVFLFIGGVFFFGPQIRNALNPNGLTLFQAVVRMLRRLFPALVTVVLATLVMAVAVFPVTRWPALGHDALTSLAYIHNLALARADNDYAAIGTDVSIYQHLWSMSVQMQIYLGSLVCITVLVALARRRAERVASTALLFATAASFLFAVYQHQVDQGWNYYSPGSRFWEIGLGGIFGIWLVRRALPPAFAAWRAPVGALGLLLIGGTGIFLDGASQFPGPWTLIPLAGAALVILAGNPTATAQPENLITRGLKSPLPQFLGRISYSLYLWHWPLLALATYAFDTSTHGQVRAQSSGVIAVLGTTRGILVGGGVIAVSIALAWATLRWVEHPTRQAAKPQRRSWLVRDQQYWQELAGAGRHRQALAAGMAALTVGTIIFASALQPPRQIADAPVAGTPQDQALYPGPVALLEGRDVPVRPSIPPASNPIESFYPPTGADGCAGLIEHSDLILQQQFNQSEQPCAYGDVEATRTMYLYGNSHAEHFLPALDYVGRSMGIRIIPLLKMSCYPGGPDVRTDGKEYPECGQWKETAEKYILDNPPTDGVMVVSTVPEQGSTGPDTVAEGLYDIVSRLRERGISVWALRDSPWPHTEYGILDVRGCVVELDPQEAAELCRIPRVSALEPINPAIGGLAGLGVHHLDLTAGLCDEQWCPGVVGNVLVYRDSSHLTDTYSALLGPELERQMLAAEPQLPYAPASDPVLQPADADDGPADDLPADDLPAGAVPGESAPS